MEPIGYESSIHEKKLRITPILLLKTTIQGTWEMNYEKDGDFDFDFFFAFVFIINSNNIRAYL